MSDGTESTRNSVQITEYFLAPFHPEAFLAPLSARIKSIQEPFSNAAQAFEYNVESVITTLSLPITLAVASAHERRFMQLNMAEMIRARIGRPTGAEIPPEAESKARVRAQEKMLAELNSESGKDYLTYHASEFLLTTLDDRTTKLAALELLRQGAVLIWGAFEVLARDIFCSFVNEYPGAAKLLTQDERTRKLFQVKAITHEILVEYNYDLSHHMGSMLSRYNDIGSLKAVRAVYAALFPENTSLREKLAREDLWRLSQRRHVIVHNRGVIDIEYLRNTGDDLVVGNIIHLSPSDIKQYLAIVRDAGMELLNAVEQGFVGNEA